MLIYIIYIYIYLMLIYIRLSFSSSLVGRLMHSEWLNNCFESPYNQEINTQGYVDASSLLAHSQTHTPFSMTDNDFR